MPIGARREELHYRQAMRRRREQRLHLQALRRRRMINVKRMGERYYVSLTKDGRVAVRWETMRQTNRLLLEGSYCYVIFDIPEHVRDVRDHFRAQLKRSGFEQVQLSVWRTRADVGRKLCEQVVALRIVQWVTVLEAHALQ